MANSIIGFHYSSGGNKGGTGAWITNANSKGIPVGLKGTDDAGLCFEGQEKGQAYGVENHLVYRVSTAGQNNGVQYDVPDYLKSPLAAAQEHFNKTVVKWPVELKKDVVWSEPINEPRGKASSSPIYNNMHPVDWLGYFMFEYAKIANSQGFKVCGPSFNSGEPGDDGPDGNPLPLIDVVKQYSRPGMLAYLQYCADNPTKAALSVHDYIWSNPPPQYPQLWGRWQGAIAATDNNGIARTFPIFVTEFGFSYRDAPAMPDVAQWLDWYNAMAVRFPQLKFVASWTLQSGYDPVDDQVITWIQYPIEKEFDRGPQPCPTHAAFGGTIPGEQMTEIRSFENGWQTLTNRLQRPNDFQLSVVTAGNSLWYGNGKIASGTVEAKHLECGKTLPVNQCVGGSDPLILDGNFVYKIQAVNMSSGTSLKTTFQETGRKRITVPVNVHWQGDSPNETDDVYVAVLMNGQLVKLLQHPELKDRTWHYVTKELDGPVDVELRFQTSYANSRDCFTDKWTKEEIMSDCEGLPRVEYTRRYNVIPPQATEQQAIDIFLEGWRRTKETAGGSYDDAGIGDLNNKIANLYGIADDQKQIFIDWYNTHYPGVTINFLSIPGQDNPF